MEFPSYTNENIIKKTLRVPALTGDSGNGEKVVRQLDVALMSVGFKLSKELIQHQSSKHPITVTMMGGLLLKAVRELVGVHVNHNVYFKEFPKNIPDTEEFWAECITDALFNPDTASKIALQLSTGTVNLLDLPKYGKYLHSYDDMVQVHDQFMPHIKDRITILHLGESLVKESLKLYYSLAGSKIPLNEEDKNLLVHLAEVCVNETQPKVFPVRENKAIINKVRLDEGQTLLTDNVTDILRLACFMSDGDVSLVKPTKFKSFRRAQRRELLANLDGIIKRNKHKLQDVNRFTEQWKRLGERLHPFEYPQFKDSHKVFEVASGIIRFRTLASNVEEAFTHKNIPRVVELLSENPGALFRSLDRILRNASKIEVVHVLGKVKDVIPDVSGRVILSLSEHFRNRLKLNTARTFANSQGKMWVTPDARISLSKTTVTKLIKIFDTEIVQRLQWNTNLVVNKDVLSLALPLSNKNKAEGFNIMPRGSVVPVENNHLRFFIYWKESELRTDYDLSGLMLDTDFSFDQYISYTRLRGQGAVHSGDITESAKGASEFIDINLDNVKAKYIIPEVNLYSGEAFDEVKECFFGFMSRTPEQEGLPFEPRTVRMKSDLRDKGRVALPLIFMRDDSGQWYAKWLHLYLKGNVRFNRIEINKVSTSLLASSIVNRQYFQVNDLVKLMKTKAATFTWYSPKQKFTKPISYIGLEQPENLPKGSKIITLTNLHELIVP